jgi:hypothetical protein
VLLLPQQLQQQQCRQLMRQAVSMSPNHSLTIALKLLLLLLLPQYLLPQRAQTQQVVTLEQQRQQEAQQQH